MASCVTNTVCHFCDVDVLRKHGHYIDGEPLRMSSGLDFGVTGRLYGSDLMEEESPLQP